MPIIKSAKKRVKLTQKATARNSKTKRSLKGAVKAFQAALTSGKKVTETKSKVQSELDKAGKKNLMHKNKVARKQRQLAAKAKAAAGASKPVAKKATPKKTAKKATAKKATAKKATAKKAPAKKPAAKKK